MLQQILREMWVDPEILAELDETQKQTLFCKMREEQVRRWRLWDQAVNQNGNGFPRNPKANGVRKQVQFLKGEDGEPWVWVMGEHSNDKSVETILAEEAQQKALQQARKEAQQLRKSVERELTHLIDYKPLDSLEQKFDISPKTVDSIQDTLEIYCTVDELRQRIEALNPNVKMPEKTNSDIYQVEEDTKYKNEKNIKNTLHFNFIEGKRDVLQELNLPNGNISGGVSGRVAAWEKRVAAARAGEIFRTMRLRRARHLRDSEQHEKETDATWREQERKAKEAEQAIREIARQAREEHRRTSVVVEQQPEFQQNGTGNDSCHFIASIPPNRDAIVDWFKLKEFSRGAGLNDDHKLADWFHGLITRSEAESLLNPRQEGSFLVRISERIWGYAISYRADDRCKHYLVDAAGPTYRFLGTGQVAHRSLNELVEYHKTHTITEGGGELLKTPCEAQQRPSIF